MSALSALVVRNKTNTLLQVCARFRPAFSGISEHFQNSAGQKPAGGFQNVYGLKLHGMLVRVARVENIAPLQPHGRMGMQPAGAPMQ